VGRGGGGGERGKNEGKPREFCVLLVEVLNNYDVCDVSK